MLLITLHSVMHLTKIRKCIIIFQTKFQHNNFQRTSYYQLRQTTESSHEFPMNLLYFEQFAYNLSLFRASHIFGRIIRSIYQTEIREEFEWRRRWYKKPADPLANRRLSIGRVYRGISNFIAVIFMHTAFTSGHVLISIRVQRSKVDPLSWRGNPFPRPSDSSSSSFSFCLPVRLSLSPLSFSLCQVLRAHSRNLSLHLDTAAFILISIRNVGCQERTMMLQLSLREENSFVFLCFFAIPRFFGSEKIDTTCRSSRRSSNEKCSTKLSVDTIARWWEHAWSYLGWRR